MDAVVEPGAGLSVERQVLGLPYEELLGYVDVGVEVNGAVFDGPVDLLEGILQLVTVPSRTSIFHDT